MKLQKLAAFNAFRAQQERRLQVQHVDMSAKEAASAPPVTLSLTPRTNMSALDTYAAAHAPVPSPPAQKARHNLLNFNFNFKARSKLGRATEGGHNKLKGRGESRRGSGSDLSGL